MRETIEDGKPGPGKAIGLTFMVMLALTATCWSLVKSYILPKICE